MHRNRALFAALVFAAGTVSAASAEDAAWPGRAGSYTFQVTRNGTPIGTQVVTIKPQGDGLVATTESTIAVKLLGVVIYRLHQVLTETYQGGRLVAIRGETTDSNGRRLAELTRDGGDHWTGHYNKEQRDFVCDCGVSTMWHVSAMKPEMIEMSLGQLRHVTIADRGTETLGLPEGKVAVHHFTVGGDIKRDVWYDPNGNLVSASQLGSDGSKIHQTLVGDPAAGDTTPQADDSPAP